MRLAHFIQRYPPALGGSEAYFARLSRYCHEQGDAVDVFTTTAQDLEAFWNAGAKTLPAGHEISGGVQVQRYPLVARFPGRRYVLKALSLLPRDPLWRCLTQPSSPISPAMWYDVNHTKASYDAVHASSLPYAFPLACAWRLARRRGVPFFLTPFLHWGDPTDPRDPTRRGYCSPHLTWLLREADGVFAQTPSEAKALASLGVLESRIHLQGLGVDSAECTGGDREAARSRWGIDANMVAIGHLANQSHEKGTNDLLACFPRLVQQSSHARLVLAGPQMPNFQRAWQAFSRDYPGLLAYVVRLGILTETQKRDFFAGIDLFALPSRSDSFGLVLLEAWANRVPNIVYRAGGPADLIRDGVDGILVACGQVERLAEALSRLANDAEARTTFGRNGCERLPGEFSWPRQLDLVRNALQRHARSEVSAG